MITNVARKRCIDSIVHIAHCDHHHNWIYHLIDLLVFTYVLILCVRAFSNRKRIVWFSERHVQSCCLAHVLVTRNAAGQNELNRNKQHTKSGYTICIVVSVSQIHNQNDKQWDEKRKFDDDDDDNNYSKNQLIGTFVGNCMCGKGRKAKLLRWCHLLALNSKIV